MSLLVTLARTTEPPPALMDTCGRPGTALALPPDTSLSLKVRVCVTEVAASACIEKPGSALRENTLRWTVAVIVDPCWPSSRSPALFLESVKVEESTSSVVVPVVFLMWALESSEPETTVRRICGVPVTSR